MPDLSDEQQIMAELLGAADAAVLTVRGRFRQRLAQVRRERRLAWLADGLPLRSHGADVAERKDFEGAVRQLEGAGLLLVARGQSGRRSVAKFSPYGETIARTLAGSFTLYDEWELLLRIGEMSEAVNGRPIAEHVIAGIRRWDGTAEQTKTLGALEWRLLPLLTAGYVAGENDMQGRYWYSVTQAGRRAIEAGIEPEPAPDDLRMDEGFADAYDAARAAADVEFAAAVPDKPSDLAVPMSCNLGWGVTSRELLSWTE